MKQLLLLIALILPSFLLAQQEVNTSKKNSINISSGVAFGYRLEGTDFKPLKERPFFIGLPMIDMTPILAINYRFGIDYQRTIIQNLSVKIGGRITNWNLSYAPDRITNKENNFAFWFIEIPLTLNYKFGHKKLQPYIELGSSPIIQLFKESGYNSSNTSISIAVHTSVGLSYQLSEAFSFFGQISGRFQTESITTWGEYDQLLFPFEIGLELGAAFHF